MAYTTRRELLEKVARNDEAAWREFVGFYAPLIEMYGRTFFLTPQEQEELRQNVYVKLFTSQAVAQYLPERGKFRTFFRTIVGNCARNLLRTRRQQQKLGPLEDEDLADEASDESNFDREWQAFILEKAKEEVRQEVGDVTYLAFEMYALHQRPPQEVAKVLKVSVNVVYLAKSRVTARLAAAVQRLSEELG